MALVTDKVALPLPANKGERKWGRRKGKDRAEVGFRRQEAKVWKENPRAEILLSAYGLSTLGKSFTAPQISFVICKTGI